MVPIFYIKVTGLTQLQSKIFRSFLRVFFVGLCGITDTNIVNAAFILVSWHNHKFIDFWQQVGGLLKVRCTIILHSQCQQSVRSKCNEVYMLRKTLISFHT